MKHICAQWKYSASQVRAQAYTMATSEDSFWIGWMVIRFLLLMALLHQAIV